MPCSCPDVARRHGTSTARTLHSVWSESAAVVALAAVNEHNELNANAAALLLAIPPVTPDIHPATVRI